VIGIDDRAENAGTAGCWPVEQLFERLINA
jgi:hypothetical protein